MKTILSPLAMALSVLLMAGCTLTREDTGALLGAVVGGVVGNQVGGGSGRDIATALGFFAGSIAGASIGKTLSEQDALNAQNALEHNKTNQGSQWVNPDNGNQYQVTPTKTYQTAAGRYCREYQTTVTVGGGHEKAYGTACRQPDGQWEIL